MRVLNEALRLHGLVELAVQAFCSCHSVQAVPLPLGGSLSRTQPGPESDLPKVLAVWGCWVGSFQSLSEGLSMHGQVESTVPAFSSHHSAQAHLCLLIEELRPFTIS